MEKLLKEVRILKIYALSLTILFALLLFMSFKADVKQKFQEIDVERINIVEKDGTLKMVISNEARQHSGMVDGKEMSKRERPAGMIFFNGMGEECGGLVYKADKESAGMVYSVDQYRNDQIMQLQFSQNTTGADKKRSYGLKLWDQSDDFPLAARTKYFDSLAALKNDTLFDKEVQRLSDAGLLTTERLFVGKNTKGEVGLFIRDEKGKPRIKIYIDKNNKTVIAMLDEHGQPVSAH
ncbi:hypothetical protein [Chitinophaga arvensicola]|uniref:Uncharacterized protein n=1 Tax=Chitinophaga arvensicola TaxID=29529 RepID=A0A1I0Q5E9_9BACT|nr:hypothetical protein [Chitinophaga arvensicola]SEW21789.1 hypothetical protein SAMN04488122_1215 [Chitinophaga arvensicola]